MADQYERDEFDEIAAAGGPVGVHRAPRPWWTLVVTPLVVFVLAGLVAYLVAQVLWNSEVDSPASPTPTVESTVESTAAATEDPEPSDSPSTPTSPEPEPSETATETAEPEPTFTVDMSTPVAVLNGTTTQGYAGEQAQILLDAGFTSVTAANLTGDRADVDRVVYAAEDQVATAEDVAARLGIDTVELGTPSSDADVEVQLVEVP